MTRAHAVPTQLLPHLRRAHDLADRAYAEPLALDRLAAEAATSKYHFVRCFAAVYGETPMRYLARRRIERAQDLLRATTLSVTEVCHLVGYTSLGTFSTRFRELCGVSPSEYQASFTAPRIPGCYVFMFSLRQAAEPAGAEGAGAGDDADAADDPRDLMPPRLRNLGEARERPDGIRSESPRPSTGSSHLPRPAAPLS